MYHCWSPPLAKPQIRECSRNTPMIERTRTGSDTPGTPGRSEHAPRTMRSIRRLPRRPRRARRSPGVDDRVHLDHDCAWRRPPRARSRAQERRGRPAQALWRHEQATEGPWRDSPVRTLNRSVRRRRSRARGEQAQVDVQSERSWGCSCPCRCGRSGAGPSPRGGRRGRLRVGLEPDQAVRDVGAGALQLASPDDVRLLVEARLDLDQDDDLLAHARRPGSARTIGESPDSGRASS